MSERKKEIRREKLLKSWTLIEEKQTRQTGWRKEKKEARVLTGELERLCIAREWGLFSPRANARSVASVRALDLDIRRLFHLEAIFYVTP